MSGGPPQSGLLTPAEQSRLAAMQVAKRRRDWLLGRWTAKHLVRAWLAETGSVPPLDAIEINAAEDGAPVASLLTPAGPQPIPCSLSISHSGANAFCALTDLPGAAAGADVETVEPRPQSLVEQFFTPGEIAVIAAAGPSARDLLVTLIWSGKEAVLKSLRLGLRADTRLVDCLPDPLPQPAVWNPLAVSIDAALAPHSAAVSLWWQARPGFVLTLALLVRRP